MAGAGCTVMSKLMNQFQLVYRGNKGNVKLQYDRVSYSQFYHF